MTREPLGRRRRRRAVELPADDHLLEARAGAGGRQQRRAQARRAVHAVRAAAGRLATEAGLPDGVLNVVTGLGATAGRRRSAGTRTSTRSPSPARRRSASCSSATPGSPTASRSRWRPAASRRSWCSATSPISTPRPRRSPGGSSTTPARPATPAPALVVARLGARRAARRDRRSSPAPSSSGTRSTRRRRSARSSTAPSSSGWLGYLDLARRADGRTGGRRRRRARAVSGAAFVAPTVLDRVPTGLAASRRRRSSDRCCP